MTNKELTIRGLLARGFNLDTTAKTSKYKVFCRTGMDRRYLVGNAGALRVQYHGRTVAESVSLTGTRTHIALQVVGKFLGNGTATVEHADMIFKGELGIPQDSPLTA